MTARSLLQCADSRRHESEPEDRLTEILAEVLRTSPLLTAWLAEQAFGADVKSAILDSAYEVDTQVSLNGGGRPDLEIRSPGRGLPGRLFCESKIRAGWTDWQLRGYPAAPQPARFVVLSPRPKDFDDLEPTERSKYLSLRWTDLARAADEFGNTWGGRDWRAAAMSPEAPGQYRLLAEFVAYLEREDVEVSIRGPITDEDLKALPGVDDVVARWKQFRDLVLVEAQKRFGPELYTSSWERNWDPVSPSGKRVAYSLTLRYGSGWEGAGWPSLVSALAAPKWSWRELVLAPKAPWMDGREYPLIGVGIGLEKLPDWTDDAEDWDRLQEAVRADPGAWMGPTNRGRIYRIVLSRPLSEISIHAGTLEAQAENAVEWAAGAVEELVAKEPGSV